jgi:hypothetical protein
MKQRYPLEAARKLRGHVVDERKAELARASQAKVQAKSRVHEVRAALAAHAAQTCEDESRIARDEERGGTAAELARGQAFRERRVLERRALAERLRDAEADLTATEKEVSAARESLAGARAEHQVVERHHDRFRNTEKNQGDARDEAEAEDLAAARRHLLD